MNTEPIQIAMLQFVGGQVNFPDAIVVDPFGAQILDFLAIYSYRLSEKLLLRLAPIHEIPIPLFENAGRSIRVQKRTRLGLFYLGLGDALFLRYFPIGVESDQKTERGTNRYSVGELIGFQHCSSKYLILVKLPNEFMGYTLQQASLFVLLTDSLIDTFE